ncbi:MAG: hypothetical protein LC808_00600 [Actinobacteria bacterium]|nr:hypothetical protein [Actinomycetota bacterium]
MNPTTTTVDTGLRSVGADLEVFVTIVGAILSSVALLRLLRTLWSKSLGRRILAHKAVLRLGTMYQVSYFISVLGPAMMKSRDNASPVGERLTEYLWVDPLYFVQAIAREDDTVVRWVVTARSKAFCPDFGPGLALNRTTFSALPTRNSQDLWIGFPVDHAAAS